MMDASVLETATPCQGIKRARTSKEPCERGRRVLVTGASGLLGRQLFRQLQECGDWQVRGLCSSRYREKLVVCDLTKEGEVEKQMQEFKPDIVIHLAAER